MSSKQAELPFDRPGELPLFGSPSVAPEPFTVPEFPLEPEPLLEPGPEPASERWTRLLWLLERADQPAPARYLVRGGRDYLDRLEGLDRKRAERLVDEIAARPLEQQLALEGTREKWKGTYWEGGLDWSDWHYGPTTPEPLEVDRCSPSVMERMRRWDLPDNGTFHIRARGVCRCGWTGPERTRETDRDYDGMSWFDALDHAYPGWRETPALPWPGWSSNAKAPCYMSGKPKEKVLAAWMALLRAGGYPETWIGRPDAPVRFIRPVTDREGFGRFVIPTYGPWENLAVYFKNPATPANPSAGPARQDSLFGGASESES